MICNREQAPLASRYFEFWRFMRLDISRLLWNNLCFSMGLQQCAANRLDLELPAEQRFLLLNVYPAPRPRLCRAALWQVASAFERCEDTWAGER